MAQRRGLGRRVDQKLAAGPGSEEHHIDLHGSPSESFLPSARRPTGHSQVLLHDRARQRGRAPGQLLPRSTSGAGFRWVEQVPNPRGPRWIMARNDYRVNAPCTGLRSWVIGVVPRRRRSGTPAAARWGRARCSPPGGENRSEPRRAPATTPFRSQGPATCHAVLKWRLVVHRRTNPPPPPKSV